ncbi:MAG: SDR family oxidoreductase [Oscillospiraceae bacterium]|nr:SDR family oxidoreductase [Oscillospiraceae bacterium]
MEKKVCVITGATGGIGTAAVNQMVKNYKVLLSDINQEKIDVRVAELREQGYEVDGMVCDTSDRAQVRVLADKAASMGPVQGVIQLAGLTPAVAYFKDIVAVDCIGMMNINEEFFRVMERGGSIMDICSCAGHFFGEDVLPMDIFETALVDKQKFYDDFTELLADYGDDTAAAQMAYVFGRSFAYWYARKCAYPFGRRKGIRVNTVSIGFVKTKRTVDDYILAGEDPDEKIATQMSYSAFGRPGTPEEVAHVFEFLIDERNSYLTGCDIYFDNGCDANGYMGQQFNFDPSEITYDPENTSLLENR